SWELLLQGYAGTLVVETIRRIRKNEFPHYLRRGSLQSDEESQGEDVVESLVEEIPDPDAQWVIEDRMEELMAWRTKCGALNNFCEQLIKRETPLRGKEAAKKLAQNF